MQFKSLTTVLAFLLFFCCSAPIVTAQVLEENADRFYITTESENETFQVCGLVPGKNYDVFFTGDEVSSNSAQKVSVIAAGSCSSFPTPFIGEGKVSVVCTDCPEQAAANNSLMDSPIVTFINPDADDLVNNVLFGGNCLNVTNAQSLGNPISLGQYTGAEDIFGMGDGIVLSTGDISTIPFPSDFLASTTTGGFGFDNDLANIVGANVNDAVSIEFDLVVPNDTVLEFIYTFASEEYCEYSTSNFNDVFGFFVSGPGIAGPFTNGAVNIAVLPDNSPTMVNGVNQFINTELFVANGFDCPPPYFAPSELTFDGYTLSFIASIDLIGGETYHFRLAIGDTSDSILDSAVFIEAASQSDYTVEYVFPADDNTIYEDCSQTVEVIVSRNGNFPFEEDLVVPISIDANSTAIEGIDFNNLPTSITIPAGVNSQSFTVTAILDDLEEGIETILLNLGECSLPQTINISDVTLLVNTGGVNNNCNSNTYEFYGATAGGVPPYDEVWTVDNGSISGDNVTITADAILTLTSTDACGTEAMYIFPLLYNPDEIEPITASISSFYECNNDVHFLTGEATGGLPPYTYQWSTGTIGQNTQVFIEDGGILTVLLTVIDACGNVGEEIIILEDESNVIITGFTQTSMEECDSTVVTVNYDSGGQEVDILWSNGETGATASDLPSGPNSVTITNEFGCSAVGTVNVVHAIGFQLAGTTTNTTGEGANDGTISVTTIGGTPPFTFVWDNGLVGQNLEGLAPGVYTVTVTDANGCIQSASFIIDPFIACSLSGDILVTDVSCYGNNDGNATVIVTSGVAPYTYQWSSGETTPTISNLAAGTYILTVTDAENCTDVFFVVVGENAPLLVEITPQDTVLCEGGDVTLGLSNEYASYQWSNGSTEPEITVDATGFYTVQVIDENGCSAFAESSVLIFNGADAYTVTGETNVTLGETITYTAETTTAFGDQLFWYVPAGGEIIGANNEASVTVLWTETGSFNLALGIVSAAGCFPDGLAIVVNVGDVINAVDDTDLSDRIQLFPNPVSDILTIKTEMNIQQIRLIDLAGRVLRTYANESRLDLSVLPAGIYFVEMETQEGIWTEKVVKL